MEFNVRIVNICHFNKDHNINFVGKWLFENSK